MQVMLFYIPVGDDTHTHNKKKVLGGETDRNFPVYLDKIQRKWMCL